MDPRAEISEFLSSRRARITPQDAGLPAYGGNRRVGLRREEVAMLAGVSVDYYTQLERGRLRGASDQVLAALGRALQLDEAELAHLHDLALAANATSPTRRRRSPTDAVRAPIQQMLDAMIDAPGWVRNERFDLLAGNALGRALYAPVLAMAAGRPNTARFAFLDPAAKTFFRDWARTADDCVATLRGAAGRNPYDKGLTDLVGELSTRSTEFRTRWAAHDVRYHRTGTKRLHHPEVGDLDLSYEALELAADPGLTMLVYGAAPGSATADALRLLGSLTADAPAPTDLPRDAANQT